MSLCELFLLKCGAALELKRLKLKEDIQFKEVCSIQ